MIKGHVFELLAKFEFLPYSGIVFEIIDIDDDVAGIVVDIVWVVEDVIEADSVVVEYDVEIVNS